jgi:hypothetical protein
VFTEPTRAVLEVRTPVEGRMYTQKIEILHCPFCGERLEVPNPRSRS